VRPEVRIHSEERVKRVVFNPASRKPVRFVDLRPTAGKMES
jgi:hypothetical protein